MSEGADDDHAFLWFRHRGAILDRQVLEPQGKISVIL
jgi:hypothetical protein